MKVLDIDRGKKGRLDEALKVGKYSSMVQYGRVWSSMVVSEGFFRTFPCLACLKCASFCAAIMKKASTAAKPTARHNIAKI